MRCGPGQSELPMQATDGSRSSSKFEAAWAPEGRGDHRHREHSLSPKDARIVNYGRARVHDAYPRAAGGRVASEGSEFAKSKMLNH